MSLLRSIARVIKRIFRYIHDRRIRDWWMNIRLSKRDERGANNSQIGDLKEPTDTASITPSKEIRVFIAVHHINWEYDALVRSWQEVAEVIHYDWGNTYNQYAPDWFSRKRAEFQTVLIERVKRNHESKSIDLFFSYLSGRWVDRTTIETIASLGIKTVNFSFDDTRLFWGPRINGIWTGVACIAPAFDLNISVASPLDIKKYQSVAARAVFLPPAGNVRAFNIEPDTGTDRNLISFIGQKYGRREEYIDYLRMKGVEVAVYGKGWSSGEISHEQKMDIYRRSIITLGFGFLGRSKKVSMKGRDFEVPMTGACYVTTWEPSLTVCFKENEEIVFYRNKKDLYEKVKWLKNNPDIAVQIGKAGRDRALREHQWRMRWKQLLLELQCETTGKQPD